MFYEALIISTVTYLSLSAFLVGLVLLCRVLNSRHAAMVSLALQDAEDSLYAPTDTQATEIIRFDRKRKPASLVKTFLQYKLLPRTATARTLIQTLGARKVG